MSDRNLRIRMLLEASDRVTRPLRDITGGSNRASSALKGTRDRLREIDRAQADLQGFRAAKTGLRETSAAMQAAQTRATQLGHALAQTSTPTRAMQRDFAKARQEAERLGQQHQRETTQLGQLRERLRTAGIATNDLARHERELRSSAQQANTELAEQSRRLEQVNDRQRRMSNARDAFGKSQATAANMAGAGMGALGAAAVVGAPLLGSAKGAMGLEEAMAGVAKVTGLADKKLASMQGNLVDLSERIPMTAPELAQIAAAAGAAGIGMDKFGRPLPSQMQDLVAFTDAAARMGIAFDMTAEDAGGTMAKWRAAFGMTQPEVEALGDRVNALTNKFGGNAAAVAAIVTRIGPLGKVAGMAAPEIAVLGHLMNRLGVEEEIAATGIKNTMLALTKGASATKAQGAAYKSLGLDAVSVSKAMQVNARGTIVDVLERVKALSKDKQASVLTELFGSESLAAIAPLLNDLTQLKREMGLVGDRSQYAGSMTQEFLSRINTTQGATDIATNALQAVNLELGQQLLPSIKAGALWFAAMAKRTRAWAQANPALAKGVMFVAAGVAVLLGLFGAGAIAIAAIMGPIALLNAGLTAMGIAGGLASVGLMPILGTAALVIAGIAALAGAAYLIYDNWSGIAGFVGGVWGRVRSFFTSNWTFIRNLLLGAVVIFAPWFAALALLAKAVWDNWGSIRAGFQQGVAFLAGIVGPVVQPLLNILSLGAGLVGRFVSMGLNLIQGLGRGILSGVGWVLKLVGNIAGSIGQRFANAMGIHSPSRLFAGYGGFMMQGLANGIGAGEAEPLRRLEGLSRSISGAIGTGLAAPALALGVAGTASAAPAAVQRPAAPVTINIYPPPGSSPEDIAKAVEEALERRDRAAAARTASSFDDEDYE